MSYGSVIIIIFLLLFLYQCLVGSVVVNVLLVCCVVDCLNKRLELRYVNFVELCCKLFLEL
eukprot:m.112896 g.112896  ORF g.112896 m.112896 type:complete len:61 (+) comp14109_c0_seq1:15-197(+)